MDIIKELNEKNKSENEEKKKKETDEKIVAL